MTRTTTSAARPILCAIIWWSRSRRPWPTDEAREARIAELQAALAPCIDTAIANFAMGLTELNDETWQDFLQTLEELGAEEFIALWQEKLDETA